MVIFVIILIAAIVLMVITESIKDRVPSYHESSSRIYKRIEEYSIRLTPEQLQEFERIFNYNSNIDNYPVAHGALSQDDYITYKKWTYHNADYLNKKFRSNVMIIGPKIDAKEEDEHIDLIFHGGCLDCKSQEVKGIERCKGCSYFQSNSKLPNLRIRSEEDKGYIINSQEEFNEIVKESLK